MRLKIIRQSKRKTVFFTNSTNINFAWLTDSVPYNLNKYITDINSNRLRLGINKLLHQMCRIFSQNSIGVQGLRLK